MSIPLFAGFPPIILALLFLILFSANTLSILWNSWSNKQHNDKLNIHILQLEIDALIYDFVKYTFVCDVNIVWHLTLRFKFIILLKYFVSKLDIYEEERVWVLWSRDWAPRLDMTTGDPRITRSSTTRFHITRFCKRFQFPASFA
jgi:hypothetical protein